MPDGRDALTGPNRSVGAVEPTVRYLTSPGGVRLAYWTLGEGEPLLCLPNKPVSSITMEWRFPENRLWFETLARERLVVGYDERGSGLSDSDPPDWCIDSLLADAESVADRLALERFAVCAVGRSTPVALAFAARHPRRVSELVLWNAHARVRDFNQLPRVMALRTLMNLDWHAFLETISFYNSPFFERELAAKSLAFYEQASGQRQVVASIEAVDSLDVEAELEKITCPVLLIQPEHSPWGSVQLARGVAAGLTDARMTIVPGEISMPWKGAPEEVATIVTRFLQGKAAAEQVPRQAFSLPREAREAAPVAPALKFPLTSREVEVLKQIAAGLSNREIAETLVLSVRTVEKHVANIYAKIEARGRADAVRYAITYGLL